MKLLGRYKNGNYTVSIYSDGTKIRENNLDTFEPDTIESMDIKITDRCDKGCEFCLKSDAKLVRRRSDGTPISANIVDVCVGDTVLSYNTENGSTEYRKVLTKYDRKYSGEMFTIEDDSGNKITCTPNHKVYTSRGYVRADELELNDTLINLNVPENM